MKDLWLSGYDMSKPKFQKTGFFPAKVLPLNDVVLVRVIIELVPLVLHAVEHVRNYFLSSALFVCSGECFVFLSTSEASRCAVLFLFGTEAWLWLCM